VNFLRSIEARRSCVTIPSRLSTDIAPVSFVAILPDRREFQGRFVFQSLTLPPTTKPVESSRKPDPFTITPVVRTPLKRPQSLSGAKNAKRQGNTRQNQKNASESFS
ncbi:hypothetical protein AB2E22_26700, partial (plasmid) [Escherichia coli]